MDKVKASIKDFTARAGQHDTTVHETVAPAVQHEVVKPHEHEEINTAVDKEVHKDHYHRSVQPVQDREVLPEQHTANLGAVQHREFDHRDHEGTKRALAADQSGFKDERVVEGTSHSQSMAATVGGEHVHHHVHETIQPVIQKETIQPSVVHTTVPIHETHHEAAKHHQTTALPAVSMSEFKERGGVLGGREERYDAFQGEPKNIGGMATGLTNKRDSKHADDDLKIASQHGDFDPRHGGLTTATGGAGAAGVHPQPGMQSGGLRGTEFGNMSGTHSKSAGAMGMGSSMEEGGPEYQPSDPKAVRNVNLNADRDSSAQLGKSGKAGLMEKLNPKTDADGDGKTGIMS